MGSGFAQYTIDADEDVLRPLEDDARERLERSVREDGLRVEDADRGPLAVRFLATFQEALSGLPRGVRLRHWALDDFLFDEYAVASRKYTLRGRAHWPQGGEACERVELNVERGELFRYSFVLRDRRDRQSLYVGRSTGRWRVSCTGRLYAMTHPWASDSR